MIVFAASNRWPLNGSPFSGATANAKVNGIAVNAFSAPPLKYPQNIYQRALQKNAHDWRAGNLTLCWLMEPNHLVAMGKKE